HPAAAQVLAVRTRARKEVRSWSVSGDRRRCDERERRRSVGRRAPTEVQGRVDGRIRSWDTRLLAGTQCCGPWKHATLTTHAPLMSLGTFRVPQPINEPVRAYGPKSPEKAALKKKLAELSSAQIEIPIVIDGEPIETGNVEKA